MPRSPGKSGRLRDRGCVVGSLAGSSFDYRYYRRLFDDNSNFTQGRACRPLSRQVESIVAQSSRVINGRHRSSDGHGGIISACKAYGIPCRSI